MSYNHIRGDCVYKENTVYIVGNSKTNLENAITDIYKSFYIGFVVDTEDDKIIDLSCSSTIRTTEEFIQSLFIGEKMDIYNIILEKNIKKRYHGSSQRAIIVAYKDALKKYNEIKEKYFN